MDKELQPLARQLGAALRTGRGKKLRQREVAERVGISVEGYARMERGAMLPSVGTLWKLRGALGLSGDQLFGGDVPVAASPGLDDDLSPEARDIMRLVAGADRQTQRRVLVVVRAMIPRQPRTRRDRRK